MLTCRLPRGYHLIVSWLRSMSRSLMNAAPMNSFSFRMSWFQIVTWSILFLASSLDILYSSWQTDQFINQWHRIILCIIQDDIISCRILRDMQNFHDKKKPFVEVTKTQILYFGLIIHLSIYTGCLSGKFIN